MEEQTKKISLWRTLAIRSFCLLAAAVFLLVKEYGKNKVSPAPAPVPGREALSLWNETDTRDILIGYMELVTDPEKDTYIPPERRIAVFDLDGTLFCETDPVYFDYQLLLHRVTEDPDYIDRATDFEKETAAKIQTMIDTGKSASGLEVDHGKCVASAFSGLTIDEFYTYVRQFREMPAPGYDGMMRGEAFYLPMVQVVQYLQDNGFTVYVVSGTDRLIVRGIVDGMLDIPARQIIGSDETIIARGQGDTDGLEYVFVDGDDLILGGDFIIKNLKMNKVSVIMQEIGVQPVLSFGNSTGDASMAAYVILDNPYTALAFMLCCDDTERENGDEAKAQKMFDLCEQYGWVPISMKNDWKTIYGDGVTRK